MGEKKRMTRVRKQQARGNSGVSVQIVIGLLVFLGATIVGGFAIKSEPVDPQHVNVLPPNENAKKDNLQLYTFGYTTVAPNPPKPPDDEKKPPDDGGKPPDGSAPGGGSGARNPERRTGLPSCGGSGSHTIRKEDCECDQYAPISPLCNEPEAECSANGGFTWGGKPFGLPDKNFCAYPNGGDKKSSDEAFKKKLADQTKCPYVVCVAKPIVYLYPLEDMLVDVKVTTSGKIFISDPVYPENGWKNILAHPDGTLEYQEKTYKELFYEAAVDSIKQPKDGLIISATELEPRLNEIITKLGLIGREHDEFLEYWLPTLRKLNAPYILFSVLDANEKERVDQVDISPKPDTFIGFIAYFKPLILPYADIKPMVLPTTPPQRTGFTAVEWGGAVDTH